jgi:hypothetical protein
MLILQTRIPAKIKAMQIAIEQKALAEAMRLDLS